ncbi:hypothetical protein [Arenimonas sp. MALMAid1274]|uniref:hypothetical protein n=1 Tax=Arenimonas sp. MALMAid1274 TaxID=3411630 RepID=UPI003B9E08F5
MSRPAPTPKSLVLTLLGLTLAAAVAVGLQARENASSKADLYGYTLADSRGVGGGSCGYDYIPLPATATTLPLAPGHGKAAEDDLAAVLPLAQPFELYQQPGKSLVVSGNGYLAAADSLQAEDGSDFSNDCSLPARADNPAASQNRIYVYHDDLRPQAGGGVRQAYFPACPRGAASGRREACTVVEWRGFERAGPLHSTQPLQAQAVLYHGSHEIALQYASVDDSQAAQATIGLQGFDGRTARQAGCNTPRRVASRQAICFFDPRSRPGASMTGVIAGR